MSGDYMFSQAADMVRCKCGTKYLMRDLPTREGNGYDFARTYFDWYSNEQIFSDTCPHCGTDLDERWKKVSTDWWGV